MQNFNPRTRALALGLGACAAFLTGSAKADTSIPPNVTTSDPVTWFASAGAVTISDGGTLQLQGGNNNPAGSATAGFNFSNAFVLAGNPGTITLQVTGNDCIYNFNGSITSTATGAQTLAITPGAGNSGGDREAINFHTGIPDGIGGLGLHVTFQNGASGDTSYVSLIGNNTFTGPITVSSSGPKGRLVIGGERYERGFDGASPYLFPGSGSLGGGNFPGAISLASNTFLEYLSSAHQILAGAISGTGTVIKEGSGTLTLSGLNTYATTTTVSAGTLELANGGGLAFVVTNASSNKVTGAGSATLDGSFTIDTTAVSVTSGSWPLVDTTTRSFGSNFSVVDYTKVGNAWTKPDPNSASGFYVFDTTTGILHLTGPAEMLSFGIPGSTGVIDAGAKTVTLTVPWSPWGLSLASLNPTFVLSSGTCTNQTSGVAPPFSFSGDPLVSNPVTYSITDTANSITNDYVVTVHVTAPSTAKAISLYFPGHGYAWASDLTGLNLLMVVPSSTNVNGLAPSYTLSPLATCSPATLTPQNFTASQNYTVTAEDGSQAIYVVTVQKIATVATGYQKRVLDSGPVAYWPLDETSGTTAFDLAAGLNHATYAGTFALNQAGLRADGNPCALLSSGNTGLPYNASLNPKQFSVECWVNASSISASQYLVSLQDRTTGDRLGYALQRNNGNGGFQFTYGIPGNKNATIMSTTTITVGNVYYVVATYDGTTIKLYVNGTLESSAAATYVPATASQPGFGIGSRNGNTTGPTYMQDVALYTHALTATEIQYHYTGIAPTLSYTDWASTKYPSANLTNPAADLDGDGVSNFTEYAFGLDPTKGTSCNPISVPFNKGTGTFSYTRTTNTGLTYTVWHSTDLLNWDSTGATQGTAADNGGGVETVPVTLDAGLLTESKLFVRVTAQ